MVNITTSTIQETTALFDRIQAKASKVKAWTGTEPAFEKSKCGTSIHAVSPETSETTRFFLDLLRSGLSEQSCFESTVRSMAEKYALLRDELLERYSDSDSALFEQLSSLNQGFENALRNAVLWFLPIGDSDTANLIESAKEYITEKIDCFFENFIQGIQHTDSQTAMREALKEAGLWPEKPAEPIIQVDMSFTEVFNVRGGKLVISVCEDGIMTVEFIGGGTYGLTNEELGVSGTNTMMLNTTE